MQNIDINCDMGESYGNFLVGKDREIFPYISACNIACGFHGGDPLTLQNTIKAAISHGVKIGAHPSYPDLQGFGRRKMDMSADELHALLSYQISALKGMTEALKGTLSYVKPHGALYHSLAASKEEAEVMVAVMKDIDPQLQLMGLPGSVSEEIARKNGIAFIREGFLDRRYTAAGSLLSRAQPDALLQKEEEVVQQFIALSTGKALRLKANEELLVQVDSLCIHGDHPRAHLFLKAVHAAAKENDIQIN